METDRMKPVKNFRVGIMQHVLHPSQLLTGIHFRLAS